MSKKCFVFIDVFNFTLVKALSAKLLKYLKTDWLKLYGEACIQIFGIFHVVILGYMAITSS